MTIHNIKSNIDAANAIRTELHEGADHLVVPVVMIVEGVLNNALVLAEEFGAFPDAWNGIPVPVLHPEENGTPVSANRPDIVERNTIGRVYNSKVEGNRLIAELWLNIDKADGLGYSDILEDLKAGGVLEVSTGYFANDEEAPGTYNGRTYEVVHRAIRPDHLALLPGQEGACSVKDGCGTRVNSKRNSLAMKVNEAWAVLAKALRLKTNCQCEEKSMDIIKKAEGLVKANMLDAKQLAAIQKMAPEDRDLMAAFIGALGSSTAKAAVEEEELPEGMEEDAEMEDMADDEEVAAMATNKNRKRLSINSTEIDRLVANKVKEHLRRHSVTERLTANSANRLTQKQMAAMTVDQLESIESMIRPADYSGVGGFAANSSQMETTVTPLRPRGVLTKVKKEA